MGPLTDVTVLDLTHYIAGPYATKLLADYGADVIKVEPPDGDPARRLGPFKDDRPGPERSGTFFYLNTNKRSVALDLRRPEGREVFARLLDRADLVVESFRPGVMDRLGVGWSFIHQRRPDLPLVSISNFGQESPYRDYQGSDLVLYALAGEMYSMGVAEREPVKMYGTAALIESGSAAAVAAMAALEVARGQGVGQHVDFSIADSHFCGVDRRHATVTAYDFCGRKTLRAAGGATGFANGVYPCADGYVEFANAGLRLDRLADMLGHPEWLQDPKWYVPGAAMNPELVDEFNAYFYAWLLERTKREVWEEARRAKVLCGPLFTVEDLFHDPHFRSRGFWQQVQHPELGTVDLPGRPFIMADSPWELRRPAPLLGQHTAEVLAEAGYSPAEVRRLAEQGVVRAQALPSPGTAVPAPARREGAAVPRGGADRARLPLAGVRVLDFTVVWAGPFATMLLGDLGAEIIKVENAHVWQPMTRGALARPPQVLLDTGAAWGFGYPNGRPGPRPWNYCPTFVNLYRNKKSCTMDLRRPEGMELLARLVAQCDVVYENNAVDTLEKLGITYDWLRGIKPDIIMVRAPAYGLTGPYAGARALGVHLEGVMGHTLLRGYPDLDPSVSTAIYSGDYLAGCQGALAVMLALWHRRRTGRGQLIELAQAENASGMFHQAFLDYALNGRVQSRIGNRSVYGFAPCGVYPCRSPGTGADGGDRWIALTVVTDAQWAALRRVMGDPEWARDPQLATVEGRAACQDLLDGRLAAWTAGFDDEDLFHRLQAAGIPAAPVLEASRVFEDAHVRARGLYQPQRLYDDVGEFRFATPFFRFPATPCTVYQPPVAMGEHNEYVYKELLGVSEEEYRRLEAEGHIAMDFDPSIP